MHGLGVVQFARCVAFLVLAHHQHKMGKRKGGRGDNKQQKRAKAEGENSNQPEENNTEALNNAELSGPSLSVYKNV